MMAEHGSVASLRTVTGLVALAACTGALFFLTLREGVSAGGAVGLIGAGFLALWLAGIAVTVCREVPIARCGGATERRFSVPRDLGAFAAVVLGALLTFVVSTDLGLGPVVASALVGIVAALLARPVAVPAYCGAFAGMASPLLFDHGGVVLAGGIAGVVYLLCVGVLTGVGGKLGTTALIGCIAAAVILGEPFLPGEVQREATPVLLFVLIPWSIAGALATFLMHTRLPGGPVFASGVVGLLGGLALPLLHGPEVGILAALAVFSASFAGMSSERRSPRNRDMALAGVLCALVLWYGAPYFGGTGGKLGTAAFGAVLGTRGLSVLGQMIWRKVRRVRRAGSPLSG
jgi:hypothetical protein